MESELNKQISPVKTIIAILIPIFELGLGSVVSEQVSGQVMKATVAGGFAVIAFLIAIYLFKDILKSEWHAYRKHIWRDLGLSLIGTILAFMLLAGARVLMSAMNLAAGTTLPDVLSIQSAATNLYATIPIILAPWTEELVFRHAIFYQFKAKGRLVFWGLFVVQAILFGLVHWFNFDGNMIEMIPYMLVGLLFGLIYAWSKNIWFNIFSHFFFNIMTPLAAALVLVLSLIAH